MQDRNHLIERGALKTQNVVDEDRPVHVFRTEPIGLRLKFGVAFLLTQLERVEIGNQVPSNTVGPDKHECANGIHRGTLERISAERLTALLGLVGYLVGDFTLKGAPVAVKRADQFAIGRHRPVGTRPGGTACQADHILLVVAQV